MKIKGNKQGNPLHIKILTLGESCAGKFSLLERYVYNRFKNNYYPTIGIAILQKRIRNK